MALPRNKTVVISPSALVSVLLSCIARVSQTIVLWLNQTGRKNLSFYNKEWLRLSELFSHGYHSVESMLCCTDSLNRVLHKLNKIPQAAQLDSCLTSDVFDLWPIRCVSQVTGLQQHGVHPLHTSLVELVACQLAGNRLYVCWREPVDIEIFLDSFHCFLHCLNLTNICNREPSFIPIQEQTRQVPEL